LGFQKQKNLEVTDNELKADKIQLELPNCVIASWNNNLVWIT